LLLMDEPTTHLDIPSIDSLVNALKNYEGTFIFISHDVYFIRQLAKTVLHVHSGRLTPYAGDYDYYLEKSKASNARAALTAGFTDARPVQGKGGAVAPNGPKAGPGPGATSPAAKKPNPHELKKLRTEVGHLEEKVAQLEAKQNDLTAELEAPETYNSPGKAQHLNRELSVLVDQLQAATTAWEVAAAKLGELEQA
jgi:ATP-binding cassette, subfamily F, member 3